MGEIIPWTMIGSLTPSGLLFLAVILILRGHLIPKSLYQVMVEAKEYWRETAQVQQQTIDIQARSIEKLSTSADTQVKVMDALQDAARRHQSEDGESSA